MNIRTLIKSLSRSLLAALIISLTLYSTAHADIFYHKLHDDLSSSFGRLTEDSSGNFQEGPALMRDMHYFQAFSAITYKGQPRLLIVDAEGLSLRIYNTNDLVNPVTSCDVSSLNMTLMGEPQMWGDNVLLAGRFNGSGGIVEVNPETGAVVNRYVHAAASYCDITVCGSKIYVRAEVFEGGAVSVDYIEMSSVGVITDELTAFEYNDDNVIGATICNEFAALDGKLYANYQITRDYTGISEWGLMRFDSTVNPSAGTKLLSRTGSSVLVDAYAISGGNDGLVCTVYESNDINLYLFEGSAPAVKIYTITPRTYTDNGRTAASIVESIYYDREKDRILLALDDRTNYGTEILGGKFVLLSRNAQGTFTKTQEIDGIDGIVVTDGSSSQETLGNDTPGSDTPNNTPGNDTPNNTPGNDTPNETPGNGTPNNTPAAPDNTNSNNTGGGSGGGGGCNSGAVMFMLCVLPAFVKKHQ